MSNEFFLFNDQYGQPVHVGDWVAASPTGRYAGGGSIGMVKKCSFKHSRRQQNEYEPNMVSIAVLDCDGNRERHYINATGRIKTRALSVKSVVKISEPQHDLVTICGLDPYDVKSKFEADYSPDVRLNR